jgi:hypothetical protein
MRERAESLRGETVVFPVSGRNLAPETFRSILGWE